MAGLPSILDPPAALGAPPKEEPDLRDIGDPHALRQRIYSKSLDAVKSWKPVEYGGFKLELDEPHYDGPEDFSLKEQKNAILTRGTLGRKLKGTWKLSDSMGQVLDQKKTTLATVPYYTPRGTIIDNGLEYSVNNQSRLRPGVFFRRKENDELEAHVNVKPGQGSSHHYYLDPEKGVFHAKIGQSRPPLMPLLHAMGITNRELDAAWGPAIAGANIVKDSPNQLKKYRDRLLSQTDLKLPENEQNQLLIRKLAGMEFDPEVVSRTMSQPFKGLDKEAMLDITKKLLLLAKGEADPDNRDDLAFQTVMGPEDIISERLAKDYGGYRRKLIWRASRDQNLRAALPGYLNEQVRSALLKSGLGSPLEETNTAELLDKQFRITRLGEGGVPGDSIPDSARAVNDSQFNFIDGIRTPESESAGVDLFLARGVRKGSDGKIYAPFKDPRSGETVYRSPQDTAKLAVAFPRQLAAPGNHAWAIQGGRLKRMRKRDVDLVVPHMENTFSPLGNLVPMKSAMRGQRMAMGSRFISQALPIVGAESPLVQSGVPDTPGESFENLYGEKMGAIRAKKPAMVSDVTPDGVTLRYQDGTEENIELANQFPFNRKSYLHQTPLVKPGQMINPGDLIAHSNYTDEKGQTALGLNARVAMSTWEGANHEDAIVISEGFANRLKSDHMYPHRFEPSDSHKVGRGSFLSLFPNKYNRRQLESIGEDGLVKPGTVVNYGDPLVLSTKVTDASQNRVHRQGGRSFGDASMTWEHHSPGVVTDAVNSPKGVNVLVRAVSPTNVADKLSGRWGNKGVISRIVPDDQMLQDKDGKPFDVLMNPLGVISRGNPAQVIEMALGKIAQKTGQPYRVPDFEDIDDLADYAQKELDKHGMSDTDDVVDPRTGKKIKGVLTGVQHIMKLHHMADAKLQGRGIGGYSADETPTKGKVGQSKRVSLQETNALLAHGAYNTLRDASQVRGQANSDFWLNFQQGYSPPEPKIPMVYRKFTAGLKASGINVVGDGTNTHIMALTDRDVDEMAGDREVKSGELVDPSRNMQAIQGGLFDPKIFGERGERWGFIKLNEPIVNPVMEDPVRHMLGLTKNQLHDVIAGKMDIPKFKGTGTEGIAAALGKINLPLEIAHTRQEISRRRGTGRDDAIRRFGYLMGAQKNKLHPKDWVISKVPVLPPAFRQVGLLGDSKIPMVSDPNLLYRELLTANSNLKALSGQVDDVGDERLALYNAHKAVVGLGDPLSKKLQEKKVTGILSKLTGTSPKMGTVQRRLLSQTVDLVGRGVISPNPDLDMDHIEIPENSAWSVYSPFVIRRLRRRGMPLSEAMRQAKDRTELARNELVAEMGERPVIASRAPTLHRFGIMSFWPQLTKDSSMHLSPLVYAGYGADNDGDQMNFHAPVSDDAVQEAIHRLLPSKNLLSSADFKTPMFQPSHEYVGGLYAATRPPGEEKKHAKRFATKADAIKAWSRNEISHDDLIEVG